MSGAKFYYRRNNQQFGPLSAEELKAVATSRQIGPDDLVWKEGKDQWVPARNVNGLLTSTTPASETPAQQAGQFHCLRNGKQFGPIAIEHLRALVVSGQFQSTDLVWQEGTPAWVPAAHIGGLWSSSKATPRPVAAPAPAASPPQKEAEVQVVVATAPVSPEPRFFYLDNGQRLGPISRQELHQRAASQQLRLEDMIWQEGTPAWVPARDLPGLVPSASVDTPVPSATSINKAGPHPANGIKEDDLIDQIMQPGEFFQYGVNGELQGGWTTREFTVVLTNQRVIMIEKKFWSFSKNAAKEWTAHPLEDLRVSCEQHFLSSTLSVRAADGTTWTVGKVRKDAGPLFEQKFLAMKEGGAGFAGGVSNAISEMVAEAMQNAFRKRVEQ